MNSNHVLIIFLKLPLTGSFSVYTKDHKLKNMPFQKKSKQADTLKSTPGLYPKFHQ
jgi:hypothetical protein